MKNQDIHTMNCKELWENFKGESCFGDTIYIDPLGFEYTRDLIKCHECIFSFNYNNCLLLKEDGKDDNEIFQYTTNVSKNSECEYFIIRNFSEKDRQDEIVRERVLEIAKKMDYPHEFWERLKTINTNEEYVEPTPVQNLYITTSNNNVDNNSIDKDDWINLAEDELFAAVDDVEKKQMLHGVKNSDNKSSTCENCKFVKRDPSRATGSPTGLICTHKNIHVTARGICETFINKHDDGSLEGYGTEWCFWADGLKPSGTCPEGGHHDWELRKKERDMYKGEHVYRQHCKKCMTLGMNVFKK
jgi:hypothetical protein